MPTRLKTFMDAFATVLMGLTLVVSSLYLATHVPSPVIEQNSLYGTRHVFGIAAIGILCRAFMGLALCRVGRIPRADGVTRNPSKSP